MILEELLVFGLVFSIIGFGLIILSIIYVIPILVYIGGVLIILSLFGYGHMYIENGQNIGDDK